MRRRSDIPYVYRQAAKKLAEQAAETARKAEAIAQKAADIAKVETHAANRALWLAVVALNETPGVNLGRERLVRFAGVLSRLTDEFEAMAAEDGQDVALARLARRVDQIMEG